MQLVSDARAAYYAANGFSDATYSDRWVRFKLGFVPVTFPSTPSRRRAIPLHDLHHVATGYATSIVGEAEIAAWELAGGCTDHWAAWILDAGAFAAGLAIAPRRTYRAFVRGRHSLTLYATGWSDQLLALEVGELRARLQLDRDPPRATWGDRAVFAVAVAAIAMPLAAGAALVALGVRTIRRG